MNATPMRLVAITAEPGGTTRGAWFDPTQREAVEKAMIGQPVTLLELDTPKLDQVDPDFPTVKLPLGIGRLTLPVIKRPVYDRLATLARPAPQVPPPVTPDTADPYAAIKVGSIVLASDSREEGWFEAVVLRMENNGATLRLKWSDFADLGDFTKPLTRVGIPPAGGVR